MLIQAIWAVFIEVKLVLKENLM